MFLDRDPVVEKPEMQKIQMAVSQVSQQDMELMATWPIFGKNTPTVANVNDSNLQLLGIIFQGPESVAIIRINGAESLLKSGSKINNMYTIHKIEPMQVIVSSSNGLQKLELFENLRTGKNTSQQAIMTIENNTNPQAGDIATLQNIYQQAQNYNNQNPNSEATQQLLKQRVEYYQNILKDKLPQ